MSDRPSYNLDGLDLDLARRLMRSAGVSRPTGGRDANRESTTIWSMCSDEGRPALRAELSGLERELRRSEETLRAPEAGSATTPEPLALRILPRSPRLRPLPR